MKISAETFYLTKKFGDREAVRLLAEAGFGCIDYTMECMKDENHPLNTPEYREYAAELRRYAEGLGVTFNQAHAPGFFNFKQEGVLENTAIPTIIRSLEIASIMGIDTVIVHPLHHLVYLYNADKLWEMNMKFYRTLIPYAEKFDVKICLENIFQFSGSKHLPMPDILSSPDRLARAVDELNSPHAVACLDIGHSWLLECEPADFIHVLCHDRLKALHVHDNDGTYDQHTLPYLGKINWESTAKALADIDYDGVFTFKTFQFLSRFPDGFLPTATRWLHEMGTYLCGKISAV